MAKRIFDIVAASCLLAVTSPVWLIAFLLDAPSAKTTWLCRIRYTGRGGLPFRRWRLREASFSPPRPKSNRRGARLLAGDHKPSRGVRLLAACRLQFLPQLLNVLAGEMSIVGPQPRDETARDELPLRYRRILAVRPGLVDWASLWMSDKHHVVDGAPYADEAFDAVIRPHLLALQLEYVNQRSLWTDVTILAALFRRTVKKSWLPDVPRRYPTARKLRANMAKLVATEQIYRRAA